MIRKTYDWILGDQGAVISFSKISEKVVMMTISIGKRDPESVMISEEELGELFNLLEDIDLDLTIRGSKIYQ